MKNIFLSMVACATAFISCTQEQPKEEAQITDGTVYMDENVEINQLDAHTWHGKGHLMFNESIYLIEGEESAILLDAGTKMPGLRKIVEGIVNKPVTLIATHVHPDHTGMAVNEWESIWINAADEVNVPRCMPGYKGEKKYLTDGQVFDLGGRKIEVLFGPGHTPGSTLFIDAEAHYGFSADAFGSTNLLVFTDLSTEAGTCERVTRFVDKYQLTHFYPGHYDGNNLETPKRIKDIKLLCEGVLDGTIEKKSDPSNGALKYYVDGDGIRVRFGESGIR